MSHTWGLGIGPDNGSPHHDVILARELNKWPVYISHHTLSFVCIYHILTSLTGMVTCNTVGRVLNA